jgi:hypothetical protein
VIALRGLSKERGWTIVDAVGPNCYTGAVAKQKGLEKLNHIELAVFCGKVADDPQGYAEQDATKARVLRHEWVKLQTPPEFALQNEQKKRLKLAAWKQRGRWIPR